jgi:RHS repeat-associated protein
VVDARGNKTSFTYDGLNRLLTSTDPLGKTDTRTYDKNGNLVQLQDRRGLTSTFTYDGLNRLVGETYPDSTVSRSYDTNGRLVRVADSMSGVFDFTYDSVGRLASSANQFGAVQYTYDNANRMMSRQVAGQSPASYSYDSAGKLLSASMPQASVGFSYDSNNRLVSLTRANGVNSQYAYDPAGRLLSLTHSGGQGINVPLKYVYDAGGNRSSASTVGQPLTTQTVASTYDNANRLLTSGSTSYSYDANGNLVSASGSSGSTTYTWDSRNHLQSIITSAGQTTNFLYDFSGNLIQQTDSGATLNLAQTFVLDALTDVAYLGRSTGDSLSILSGSGIDSHFAAVHQNGQVEYGLTDAINSTVQTVDQAGAMNAQFFYEPFGQTTAANSYPFQYTGRVPTTSDLYNYRARYYSSATGRFISQDPAGSGNAYRYAANSPVQAVDPRGLWTVFVGGSGSLVSGIGGQAGGGVYINGSGQGIDFGLYGSAGPAGGVEVGYGPTAGFVRGPLSNFQNLNYNASLSFGFGGTAIISPNGQVIGGALTIGDIGEISLGGQYTKTFSLSDWLSGGFQELFGGLSDPQNFCRLQP